MEKLRNLTSNGHNLDSGTTCGFSATGGLGNSNPLLGPLRNNGGFAQTEALCTGVGTPTPFCKGRSVAIDAGGPTQCPATDERNEPRLTDGRCVTLAPMGCNPTTS